MATPSLLLRFIQELYVRGLIVDVLVVIRSGGLGCKFSSCYPWSLQQSVYSSILPCILDLSPLLLNKLVHFSWADVDCTNHAAVLPYRACRALPRSSSLSLSPCLGQYITSDSLPARLLDTVFSISVPALGVCLSKSCLKLAY